MNKVRSEYRCDACGARAPKWAGQCVDCGAWNTLVEALAAPTARNPRAATWTGTLPTVQTLSGVAAAETPRISTGIGELDRVLGGGLVAGSVTLIGGDPGIGKSTLLLQAVVHCAQERPVLYVTGEESPAQVALRASRLGADAGPVQLLAETCVERVIETALAAKPAVLVVDSIQTTFTETLQSAPGAVAQLRESAAQLVRFAKQSGTAVFLVGHVTKEGTIAGPRVLEHMVDTVLYFENDLGSRYRVIRAVKNRFGAVNELGVFAMTDAGLKEVANPSAIFLSRHEQPVAGSVITVVREGSRPMLVELQALVDASPLHNPRRMALGFEQNRLVMLLAVLHRHAGVVMSDQDVFVNMVGGIRVTETSVDLAVLLAALSSYRDRPLPPDLVVFGEVGLAGEVRPVPHGEERLREAAKHGFKRALVPAANAPRKGSKIGIKVEGVARLADALSLI
ncbi:MAG: DNA repair protein RadA [Xanthomonadaceae bacterium]|nr:DNA repair protein RadA [Xanthomonadaceae bacterium]